MGALTFKPSAFQYRSWEIEPVQVDNFFGFDLSPLVFHFKGHKVVKITSQTWLQDRVRFIYDSFRRQRLVTPLIRGVTSRWSHVISSWMYLVWKKKYRYKLDGQFLDGSLLIRFYSLLGDNRGSICAIGVDSTFFSSVYHGAYGFISTFYSMISFPCSFCYEEINILSSSVSVISFKVWAVATAQTLKEITETEEASFLALTFSLLEHNEKVKAVFQISPFQRLLID